MANDEEIVGTALRKLYEARAKAEQEEYDFFFNADRDVQEAYYQYWRANHETNSTTMPRFLKDYEVFRRLD